MRRNGAEYRLGFGEAMKQIAQLVKADLGLEVAFAELGQWDHHANEGASTGQIANRLNDFSRAVAAFAQDLGDRMADVVVVTMGSGDGAENGNRGTDHGSNAMLVLGGNVMAERSTAAGPRARTVTGCDLAIDGLPIFAECVTRSGSEGHFANISRAQLQQRLGFIRAGSVRCRMSGWTASCRSKSHLSARPAPMPPRHCNGGAGTAGRALRVGF
jgi:hypothetical protein